MTAVCQDQLYFILASEYSSIEIWVSDGSVAGTRPAVDLNGYNYPTEMTAAGNLLFFGYNDGVNGDELWRSDGTQQGTYIVKNLAPGDGSSIYMDSRHPTPYQEQLFFTAEDRQHGIEIWRTDGSEANTLLVTDITPGLIGAWPQNLTVAGEWLYFVATDETGTASLWQLDLGIKELYLPLIQRGP